MNDQTVNERQGNELESAGGCLCGRVRYRVQGPLGKPCHCHCESCRKAAGAAFVTWVTAPLANFAVSAGELAIFSSSPGVARGFCRNCGTSLTYAYAGRADEIDITLASFDDPGRVKPRAHIFVEDKLPWIHLGDELPQYQKVPD